MKKDMEQELFAEVILTKEKADALYAEQEAKRNELLAKPENQELLKELRERRTIAEALHRARKEARLTQTELAERLHVSQPYIAKLEQGKGSISWKMISKYAAACGKIAGIALY